MCVGGGGGGGITRVRRTVDVSSPITHTVQVRDRSLSTRRGGGGGAQNGKKTC